MKIQRLYLKNFRGFAEQEFKFQDRLTLIVGENGSGKTSLLEALSVALGGWLRGFDGLEAKDKRNLIKADRRAIIAKINTALLEQIPVEVKCEVKLQTGEGITWSRNLRSLSGRTTVGNLRQVREISEAYNIKIFRGEDADITLPLVAYYSAARLWNEPIHKERKVNKDKIRLDGYKGAISSSNSIKDTMHHIDRLALLAYRNEDKDALAKMNAILKAIGISLNSVLPDADVYYDMKLAEFCIKTSTDEIKAYSLLSDGYRCVISLIIDICMRIMTLNPQLGEAAIQNTGGVVLIDEIDLHVHPRWQQKILGDLTSIFPQLQFIATTHSPSVVQSVNKENLMILDGDQSYYPSQSVYGRDVNSILTDIMGARTRPEAIEERFSIIYDHLDAGEFSNADQKVSELEEIVGENDPELNGIKIAIDFETMED